MAHWLMETKVWDLEGEESKIAAKENHFCFQMSCAKCRWLLMVTRHGIGQVS